MKKTLRALVFMLVAGGMFAVAANSFAAPAPHTQTVPYIPKWES